jgi:Spy/CpxP family protein refolding chaperone
MKTNALLVAALLSTPLVAQAAPKNVDPTVQAEHRERAELRQRTMRVVGLAEVLNLNTADALKMDAAMKPFDDQREPLREQMKADGELLQRAADGDPSATTQVDAALQRIFDARAQIETINRQMLETISKGMTPQQKAKMAMFLAKSHEWGKHGGGERHGRLGK